MQGMKRLGIAFALVMALTAAASAATKKKIIAFGWEYQKFTPAQLLAEADKLKDLGIDGVGISLRKTSDTGEYSDFRKAMVNGPKYKLEDFADQLDDLKKIAAIPHLKHSFILGYNAPRKRLAWADDEAWSVAANNMAMIGQVAKATGLKGVSCDHEDYYKQHQYVPAPGEGTYDELKKLARRRGREVFSALFRELPDARVLFYWFLTFEREYFTVTDPERLIREKQDLWPAFADGILDALPPTAVIIDGDEHAYTYSYATRDFHASACNQRLLAPKIISPENRDKYIRQVQTGFGLYLDMYTTAPGSYWYSPPVNGSRTEHFRRNLADAVFLADEYVWLWGERHVTVHWGDNFPLQKRIKGVDRTWDEVMPGWKRAMTSVRDRDGGLGRAARELEGKPRKDLNPNPACMPDDEKKRKLPEPYSCWRPKKNADSILEIDRTVGDGDSFSLSMARSRGSSYMMTVPVSGTGDAYEASIRAKYVGVKPVARISWRTDGRWAIGQTSISIKFSEPDPTGWCTGKAIFKVPPGVDSLAVVFGSERHQRDEKDKIWFDNIRVLRVW